MIAYFDNNLARQFPRLVKRVFVRILLLPADKQPDTLSAEQLDFPLKAGGERWNENSLANRKLEAKWGGLFALWGNSPVYPKALPAT
jgi:hypothetical protein